MLEQIKKELTSQGVFNGELPPILRQIVEAIPNQRIPTRMKYTIAVSELVLFASHMRKNIAHWNGSLIPINAITFSVSASGTGKDSSVTAARKCFNTGYKLLDKKRKDLAVQKAIRSATLAGKDNPEEWATYKEFYHAPNPLFIAPSTAEGFIQHLNDLDDAGTGAGFIYSGEFGSELANSSVLVENIKLLAELYDEGRKEVKVLKNRENQSKEILNLPVSSLFVGSQDNLLFDEAIKRKFKTEFSTKLARRSFFNYSPETIPAITYPTTDAMLEAEFLIEDRAVQARNLVDTAVAEIAEKNLNGIGRALTIDVEVRKLFLLYKRYNEELSETIKSQYPIAKLARTHLQWKALKLAGAIAIFNAHKSIEVSDYISAISFVEMLDKDLQNFEAELVKEPYEIFVDFAHYHAVDGKFSIGLHTLRKLGYIPTTGQPQTRMKELVHLASSYDVDGIYTVCEEGICYEAQVKSDVTGVSFVEVSGTKEQRQKQCASGYTFYETDFAELAAMLQEDYAYTPFQFKDGKRSTENLIGGCSWVVLDIDDSKITDEEAHFMLSDINHHIARTSDAQNPFKFRVLLELDSIVDIPSMQWKHFITSIADDLSIPIDMLPKSQIYFSYAGREVLSTLDGEPLQAKKYIMESADKLAEKGTVKPTVLPKAQQKAMLDDPLGTFSYAYEAKHGEGSRSLIRAAKHAKDLGASTEELVTLMNDINNYWTDPIDESTFERTILSQVRRM